MADFATWRAAIARALGNNERESQGMEQKFLHAYDEVMERQNVDVVEANPIGPALLRWYMYVIPTAQDEHGDFYRKNGYWEGGPGQLLAELTTHAEVMGFDKKDREWPKKPFMLVKVLKPIVPDLKKAYRLNVHIYRDTKGEKTSKNSSWIEIKSVSETPSTPSTASTDPKTRSDSDDSSGGSENATSTKAPPTSTTTTCDQDDGYDGRGGTTPTGGGSAKTASTKKVQNHPQNPDGGGSGGSGGTLGEKNIILSSNVTLASESVVASRQVSPIALELAKMRNMPMLNCPYPKCSFKNIHQESVDHHIQHKHGLEEEEE